MKKWTLILLALAAALALSGCKCAHPETTVQNAAEATCLADGYTGDTVCLKCSETVSAGQIIPAAGHSAGEPVGQREADCDRDGSTGDVYCITCNEQIAESQSIPAAGHIISAPEGAIALSCSTPGFSGHGNCDVCGAYTPGYYTPKLEHSMENGTCTACGYREPGLYDGGILVTPWDQLESNGLVVLYERIDDRFNQPSWGLDSISGDLTGELVVSEKITALRAPFEACNLTKVVLPGTLSLVSDYCFSRSPLLEEVVFLSHATGMGNDIFRGCTALCTVQLPAGLTRIDSNVFDGCTSLAEITLPDTIKEIRLDAFKNCTSLVRVELPESLADCMHCFEGCTSLTTLVWPASLTNAYCLSYTDMRPEILYRGTQEQWAAVTDADKLSDASIVFGYAGE